MDRQQTWIMHEGLQTTDDAYIYELTRLRSAVNAMPSHIEVLLRRFLTTYRIRLGSGFREGSSKIELLTNMLICLHLRSIQTVSILGGIHFMLYPRS
jgi:hypothetical protein